LKRTHAVELARLLERWKTKCRLATASTFPSVLLSSAFPYFGTPNRMVIHARANGYEARPRMERAGMGQRYQNRYGEIGFVNVGQPIVKSNRKSPKSHRGSSSSPAFPCLQMPPLSVLTFWTFQVHEWLDAFWAYQWLFIYCRSGFWDDPLSHRQPTRRAELRIPDGFSKLLTVSSRANVYFHEVTPLCLADRTALRRIITVPQTGGKSPGPLPRVRRLAVALSWGRDLFLNGWPFPR
jgi:hypothetical protein